MNKRLLLPLLLFPLIAGCSMSVNFDPLVPWVPDPDAQEDEGGGDDPGGDEGEKNLTVYFFLDFSHSEVDEDEEGNKNPNNPGNYIYKMDWWALKPLGEMPAEAAITDSMAADPHFGHFIGYSKYSSALDESLLWDWANDYEASNTLNLYGIWVAQ